MHKNSQYSGEAVDESSVRRWLRAFDANGKTVCAIVSVLNIKKRVYDFILQTRRRIKRAILS